MYYSSKQYRLFVDVGTSRFPDSFLCLVFIQFVACVLELVMASPFARYVIW